LIEEDEEIPAPVADILLGQDEEIPAAVDTSAGEVQQAPPDEAEQDPFRFGFAEFI
jgi:hypothetical protein